tara:strand:- start:4203 stop:5723 length:1521 start_codon:yes stop_codon:yes gene_type:complete
MNKKIIKPKELIKKISELKKKNKKIVQCHGVFDILHLGHIKHFLEAKKNGDILIVTVTSDKFVNKGSNRPVFKQNYRMELLAELECVNFVCLSDHKSAIEVLKNIKPNVYIKGQDYKNLKKDKTGNILLEKKIVEKNGGKIIYTNEETFSSSTIINNNFSFNEEQKKHLSFISNKYTFETIYKIFQKISNLKVLVIGETIIDQYNFCEALGKSGKEPYLALKDIYSEDFLGGAAAIANHIIDFTKKVKLISIVGENDEYKNFIKKKLNKKIQSTFFKKKNSPTILKKRFIDNVSKNKLFGIYSINDEELSEKHDTKISRYIENNLKNFDLIIVSDYGHGFISNRSAKKISKTKNFVALNAQVNASNIGYHTLQKYDQTDAMIINETELRHEMRNKNEEIKSLSNKLFKRINTKNLVVTRGKNGALLVNKKEQSILQSPAFANNIVDKVGAGDAMLSIISMLIKIGAPRDLSLLLGSFAGAFSVETIANSSVIKKAKLLRFIEYSLK